MTTKTKKPRPSPAPYSASCPGDPAERRPGPAGRSCTALGKADEAVLELLCARGPACPDEIRANPPPGIGTGAIDPAVKALLRKGLLRYASGTTVEPSEQGRLWLANRNEGGREAPQAAPGATIAPDPSQVGLEEEIAAHARSTDPDTSKAAAAGVSVSSILGSRGVVLRVLTGSGPCTDEEMCDYADMAGHPYTHSRLRTARSELVDAGHVADSGKKRPTRTGSQAIVWRRVAL